MTTTIDRHDASSGQFRVVGTRPIRRILMIAIQALEIRTAKIAELTQLVGEQWANMQRMEERLISLEDASGDANTSAGLPSFSLTTTWLLIGGLALGGLVMGGGVVTLGRRRSKITG